MGLILSVLVACVGVYKFLRIYRELGNGDEQQQLRFEKICTPITTEDVEIECKSEILARNRRFLVTETRSTSPRRKFLITKDEGRTDDLREFVITKRIPKDDATSKKFVLIDTDENYKEISPLPLPKRFLITHQNESVKKTIKQAIGIDVNALSCNGKQLDLLTLNHKADEVFHRDPSPYPLNVPTRTSFNTELLSVVELDNQSNKIDVILETRNNITAYTTNKILVIPPELLRKREKQRSKSACRNEVNDELVVRRTSSCSKLDDYTEPTSIFINLLKNGRNEEFRRSLDGVKRASESRRSFKKRKNRSQNSLENEEIHVENEKTSGNSRICAEILPKSTRALVCMVNKFF